MKKIIIILMMILCFSQIASADLTSTDPDLIAVWDYNIDANETLTNTAPISSVNFAVTSDDCVNENCYVSYGNLAGDYSLAASNYTTWDKTQAVTDLVRGAWSEYSVCYYLNLKTYSNAAIKNSLLFNTGDDWQGKERHFSMTSIDIGGTQFNIKTTIGCSEEGISNCVQETVNTSNNYTYPFKGFVCTTLDFNGAGSVDVKQYVNGSRVNTVTLTGMLNQLPDGTDFEIPMYHTSYANTYIGGQYFGNINGNIDELYIWNRTLSDSEVTDYSGGLFYPFTEVNLTTNLITYYKSDDATTSGTTAIDSVGNYNATLTGATSGAGGIINEAYEYDGTTDYTITGTDWGTGVGSVSNFGVSFWYNNTNAVQENVGLWYAGAFTSAYGKIQVINDYTIGSDIAILEDNIFKIRWNYSATPTSYSHIVVTANGTDILFYHDGDFEASFTANLPYDMSGLKQVIGGWYSSSYTMTGQIDEVGFWDRTLTEEDVAELYNLGVGLSYPFENPISTANLISCYDFEETTGTNTVDTAGYLNGTTANSMVLGDDGISGYGYNFSNPNAKVTFSTTGDYNFLKNESEDYTIAAWLYAVPEASLWEHIIKFYEDGNSYLRFANVDVVNNIYHYIKYGANIYNPTSAELSYNQWSSAVWIFDDDNFLEYINGVLTLNVTNANISHAFPNADAILGVENVETAGWDWDGMMDTFTFFDRAWSTDEVNAFHNSGTGGNCSDYMPALIPEPVPVITTSIEFVDKSPLNATNFITNNSGLIIPFEFNVTGFDLTSTIQCNLSNSTSVVNTINLQNTSYIQNVSTNVTFVINGTCTDCINSDDGDFGTLATVGLNSTVDIFETYNMLDEGCYNYSWSGRFIVIDAFGPFDYSVNLVYFYNYSSLGYTLLINESLLSGSYSNVTIPYEFIGPNQTVKTYVPMIRGDLIFGKARYTNYLDGRLICDGAIKNDLDNYNISAYFESEYGFSTSDYNLTCGNGTDEATTSNKTIGAYVDSTYPTLTIITPINNTYSYATLNISVESNDTHNYNLTVNLYNQSLDLKNSYENVTTDSSSTIIRSVALTETGNYTVEAISCDGYNESLNCITKYSIVEYIPVGFGTGVTSFFTYAPANATEYGRTSYFNETFYFMIKKGAGQSINCTLNQNGVPFRSQIWSWNESCGAVTIDSCFALSSYTEQQKRDGLPVALLGVYDTEINYTEFVYDVTCFDDYTTATTPNNKSLFILVDTINPLITTLNFTTNKTWGFTNVTGSFNFTDSGNLYRWNVSLDGVAIDGDTNVSYNSYVYNFSKPVSELLVGYHYLEIILADGHTATEIPKYKVKVPFFTRKNIEFVPPDGASIKIESKDVTVADFWSAEKMVDRYVFDFYTVGEEFKEKYEFIVTGSEHIDIYSRGDTKIGTWLVMGDHWIDFYLGDELAPYVETTYTRIDSNNVGVVIDINLEFDNMINDFEIKDKDKFKDKKDKDKKDKDKIKDDIDDTDYNVKLSKKIKSKLKDGKLSFNSIGDLNIVSANYSFYSVNTTYTYSDPVYEQTNNSFTAVVNVTGTPLTYNNISGLFVYNNTNQSVSKTWTSNLITFTSTGVSPAVNETTNVTFNWGIQLPTFDYYYVNNTHEIYFVGISSNCSEPGYVEALTLCGADEETLLNVTQFEANIALKLLDDGAPFKEFGFEFDDENATCYDLCISPATASYEIDAKIEYRNNGSQYTDRKYFLNNYTLNNDTSTIWLYNLLDDVASDIILTVYDRTDGAKISDAYIKVLRYYPGLDNGSTSAAYRTVEIEKTDNTGETLAKMILGDVWYKFIIEKPAGNILLDGDIEKILTTDKLLPVSLGGASLLTYNELLKMNGEVSCDFDTDVCSFTWSNPTGESIEATLKIYQDTGFAKLLLYNETVDSSSGTIAYAITGNTTNKKYLAEGWVSS